MAEPFSRLRSKRFPRSGKYSSAWIAASGSSGSHTLWLTEWLTQALDLRPGMRVLDLGCGRAASSIFLHREFGVQVWAADLWFNPTENLLRIRDAGVEDGVFPVHADARALPFANEFFDAIVSIESFMYYATDEQYLPVLARFVKPGGLLAFSTAGLVKEIEGQVPEHLRDWWEPGMNSLHCASWWRRLWERSGVVDIELADQLPDGWRAWLDWQQTLWADNKKEIKAIEADRGRYLGYTRVVARRRPGVQLQDPIVSFPIQYTKELLLREG